LNDFFLFVFWSLAVTFLKMPLHAYNVMNTEQFSRINGWNVKNGELSELQMFRTETKSFSKQIKFIFYSGKETEK